MLKKAVRCFAWLGLLGMAIFSGNAAEPVKLDIELNCRNYNGQLTFQNVDRNFRVGERNHFYSLYGKNALTKEWQKQTIEFVSSGSGKIVIGFAGCSTKDRTRRIDIDDIRVENIEVRNPSFEQYTGDEAAFWRYYTRSSFITNSKSAFHGKNYMSVNYWYTVRGTVDVTAGKKVRITFMARDGGNLPEPEDKTFKSSAGAPTVVRTSGNAVRVAIDGFYSEVKLNDLKFSSNMHGDMVNWHSGEFGKNTAAEFSSLKAAGKDWERYEISFVPSRHGEVRILLRSSLRGKNGQIAWVDYDAMSAKGVQELRNPSFETVLAGYAEGWEGYPWNFRFNKNDAADGKNYIAASHDRHVIQTVAVKAGERVTLSFYAKDGGLSPAPNYKGRPPSKIKEYGEKYYRLYDKRAGVHVAYLPLADKGLKKSDIDEWYPGVELPDTPAPQAKFTVPDNITRAKVDYLKVPFELLEESGVARDARIRFGFPMAQGQFFNLNSIRVLDPAGKEVPAQFSVLTFWPDKSIKSVLVQFTAPLKANEKCNYFIEAGQNVSPAKPAAGKLAYTDNGSVITVDTGVMKGVIDKKNFNFLKSVTVNGKYAGKFSDEGIVLTTEKGEKLTPAASPVKITLEEKGPYCLTFRVDGAFRNKDGELFNCISRMSFYAGSAEVNFEVRFINTYLETEFNDFKSIVMSYIPAAKPADLTMNGYKADRFFQHHDKKLQVGDKFNTDRLSGSGSVKTGNNAITFNLFKAALRYPKAFSINGDAINFEILPAQPDKNFGNDLEYYLRFPLCEGFYRMKWGMGFRENITIDFAGKTPAAVLSAEEVIAIVDRDYLAGVNVYQGIQPKKQSNFDSWDAAAVEGFYSHMRLKEKQREYGFLNYGDWFGERGRNWANNEYDFAHGLFMLSLRTGNRDAFRWAKITAQHQADVDIVLAYPDKTYIGANTQHGIGHTGVSFYKPKMATWSFPHLHAALGTNGHSWSAGMCEAWMLSGDAETMNSALLLGEHLANITAPLFLRLTTHERSAGWSNIALIHLYRATSDPRYMAASRRLVERIMAEQKKDIGGAWPHKMPGDHGSNKRGTYGNCPYLVGILLESLRQHYLINPDPAVKDAIIYASNWEYRSFRPDMVGWGYGVSWDNKPYNPIGTGTNMLSGPGVATGARLSKDAKLYNAAKLVAAMITYSGFSPIGKNLSIQLCLMPSYIDELNLFASENPGAEPYSYSDGFIEQHLNNYPAPESELKVKSDSFRVRGALNKEFRIIAGAENVTATIRRNAFGSRFNGENSYSAKLVAPDGKVVTEFSGNASEKVKTVTVRLNGRKGDEYRLLIRDDFKGIWHAEADGNSEVYSLVLPKYTYSNNSVSSFNIHIPEGVNELPLEFTAIHPGIFRVIVLDKNGRIETISSGYNKIRVQPWELPAASSMRELIVKPAADGSRVRHLVVFAGGDVMIDTRIPGVKISLLK